MCFLSLCIQYGNSDFDRSLRSASAGALGGSRSLGNFRIPSVSTLNVDGNEDITGSGRSHQRSNSVNSAGLDVDTILTPSQLGRQELYQQVPFQAVFGLQKTSRTISEAFASYAAELDIQTAKGLSEDEKELRSSRASMMILDELEFDASVVTTPLVFAIIVAAASQFLVGYNTGKGKGRENRGGSKVTGILVAME